MGGVSELPQGSGNRFNTMNGQDIDLSYEFGPFRLEPATRRLLRAGESLPLTPKAFDTLLLLVQNNERVVEKEEVLRRVWPDAVVEESNLAQNVFTLRKALGDTPEGARFIATVPRRGYRFVAPVTPLRNGDRTAAAETFEAPASPFARDRGTRARAMAMAVIAAVAAVGLPLAGYLAGRRAAGPQAASQPKLSRLTFRRGIVNAARFAPDGRTVVYSASWDGRPSQLFLSRPDSPESLALDAPSAELLAISRSGELAISLQPSLLKHMMGEFRTLARAQMAGGVPREVLQDVEYADWSPDGQNLVVVRKVENQIEAPRISDRPRARGHDRAALRRQAARVARRRPGGVRRLRQAGLLHRGGGRAGPPARPVVERRVGERAGLVAARRRGLVQHGGALPPAAGAGRRSLRAPSRARADSGSDRRRLA